MTVATDRRSAWTNYWSSGALHSLTGTLPDDYAGKLGRFWHEAMSWLEPEHRVLDLGTGNGALPAFACRLLPGRLPRIDAVDLAELAPLWLADAPAECRAAVHFHPRCEMEQLPFEPGSFHLVASQYALEYTDLQRSVAEIGRVLAPGGRVALILHAEHSRLAHVARAEASHSEWLLRPDGYLTAALALYPFIARAASPEGRAALQQDPQANASRARYNEAVASLTTRAEASDIPDLLLQALQTATRLTGAAAATGDARVATQPHVEYVAQLRNAALRYEELVEHALDAGEADQLVGLMEQAGLVDCRLGELFHENGALLGWTFTGRRPR